MANDMETNGTCNGDLECIQKLYIYREREAVVSSFNFSIATTRTHIFQLLSKKMPKIFYVVNSTKRALHGDTFCTYMHIYSG